MKKIFAFILAMTMLMSAAYAAEEASLSQFTAPDISGVEWTEEIFAGYDLTMVQIWATWCAACVSDIPKLAAFKDELPENVNLITICDTGEYDDPGASQVMVEYGSNYITLLVNNELYDELVSKLMAVPATVFVDSEGNLVGDIQLGDPNPSNRNAGYMQLIEERLALLGL